MSDDTIFELIIGASAVFLILLLVFYVLAVIAYWKIFKKAGEPGWKSIIPFYNTYIIYKISWNAKMFWLLLISLLVAGIGDGLTQSGTAGAFASVLYWVGWLAYFFIRVFQCKYMSKSYGHGNGFAAGLYFLPTIFSLILGFGSSQYEGNGSEMQK